MAFVHVQASDGESADDEEEHHGEEEPEEHEDPSLLSEPSVELSTPKETCAVLVKRFHQLLRAGRHSSGSRFQLAVHAWLNTCNPQGSRTIRTEESLLISLARLQPHVLRNTPPGE